jgi:type I restriction enzyme S subunit
MAEHPSLKTLPKGWTATTIPQMISVDGIFVDGDWVESKDQDPKGDVRLIQLADVGDRIYRNKSERFLTRKKAIELNCTFLKNNDILIARMPDPLGRACIFPRDEKPCVTVVDVCIVRSGRNSVDHKWLMYTINSPQTRSAISSLQSGSTRKRISRRNLSKITIPVPPISEQKRLVSKLEELFTKLDAGIEALKKTEVLLKQYRQSVLKYALEGKLTEAWRNKNKSYTIEILIERINKERKKRNLTKVEFLNFNRLDKLPPTWKWVTLGQVFDVIMGQSPPGNSYNVKGEGMPLLNGPTEFGEKYPSPIQWTKCVRGNTTGRMNWSNQRYCIGRGLAAIRPVTTGINNKILYFFLILKANELISNTTGSTFPNLKSNELNSFPFPLIPLEEQNKIVCYIETKFSIMENTLKVIQENKKYCDILRQSILKVAFAGKLIPQDPNDESAEILLQRIKQLRTEIGSKLNSKRIKNKSDSKQKRLI